MLCARNHCSAALRSHGPLEIAAPACRGASWRSKSPLEHAFSCSATPANAAPASALGASAQASNVRFDNAFAIPVESLSKSLSKSLCFEFCIASSCALRDSTGTVRCHMRISYYIYIDIIILESHMAPDSACGVAQSTARSNAKFEAERSRKGFRKGFHRKRECVDKSNDACSSRGSER